MTLHRQLAAEAIGTALLLAIVVGSGIMGERLAQGNAAIALLANSIATGAGLYVLITALAPISFAHFNPVVTVAVWLEDRMTFAAAVTYVAVQCVAAWIGVLAAHAMFGRALLQVSAHARSSWGECLGEVLATFGLVLTIRLTAQASVQHVAAAVALWITAAYWFTSSTSFANPAVTIARSLTGTFSGIAPNNIRAFIASQLIGGGAALLVARGFLVRSPSNS